MVGEEAGVKETLGTMFLDLDSIRYIFRKDIDYVLKDVKYEIKNIKLRLLMRKERFLINMICAMNKRHSRTSSVLASVIGMIF